MGTGDGKLISSAKGTKRSLGSIDLGEEVDGFDGGDFVNLFDDAGVEGSVNITEIVDALMARAVGFEGRGLNPVGTDGPMPRQEVEVGA
jgi:hypothetical protein